jgi:hypothetical protein
MSPAALLLPNLALASYAVGAIWVHEVDICRSWTLVDSAAFGQLQLRYWQTLPSWVFLPVGLMFLGSISLLWYHPAASPRWGVWGAFRVSVRAPSADRRDVGTLAGETEYR